MFINQLRLPEMVIVFQVAHTNSARKYKLLNYGSMKFVELTFGNAAAPLNIAVNVSSFVHFVWFTYDADSRRLPLSVHDCS